MATSTERNKRMREYRKKSDIKRLELWPHVDDHKPIKELAKLLSDRRAILRDSTKEK